ncbi:DSS1 [Mytilus edulis]|uniref:26S proteasome complex subunit SEM1 n=1 Tax=Mytilus edulis TaxID=6550 RepID=A0A8S3SMQ9_MYTED|nr:DSS1 [Mytilus edulis]
MDDMLFHRSAVFTIDPSLEIHILCEDERIFVRLVHAKNKVLILKDLASSICDCLKSALENISQLYIKTSSDNSELSVGTFEMNLCCSVAKDPCLLSIGEFNKIDSIWEIMKKCEITCPDWTEENEDEEDINVWEDNWDDDNLDDDFSVQLRAELEKQGKNADGSEPMKT